jgi:hypothetical protein
MAARKQSSQIDMNSLKIINLAAPAAASNDAVRKVDAEAVQAFAISRANHTGTQLAATVSDFDTQVRTSRLDQLATPTGSVGLGSQKVINLLDPTAAQDAATKAYVDTQLAAVATGQVLKGTVRAVSLTNVNTASAPSTIDGITPANGDVFLLAAQTTGAQNGPYVWTAAGAVLARAANWASAVNTVTIKPDAVWATNEFHAVVSKS